MTFQEHICMLSRRPAARRNEKHINARPRMLMYKKELIFVLIERDRAGPDGPSKNHNNTAVVHIQKLDFVAAFVKQLHATV